MVPFGTGYYVFVCIWRILRATSLQSYGYVIWQKKKL